jgi:predicted nucleic acid-binding protein
LIVLDASAVIDVLVESGPGTESIRERIEEPGQSLHVPQLVDLEVLQTLRRYALHGTLSQERSNKAFDDLTNIVFERYPHTPLLGRIWQLKNNLTAYDATYVALAQSLTCHLITADERLVNKLSPKLDFVRWLGDPAMVFGDDE